MKPEELPSLKIQVSEEYLEKMTQFWNSIDELLKVPMDEGGELPRWVHSIHDHLNKTIYTHLYGLRSGTSDAYKMGVAIGAMKKMMNVLTESYERLDKVKIEIEVPSSLQRQFQEVIDRVNEIILPEDDIRGLQILAYGYLVNAFENWDWRKARDFFRGIANGLGTVKTTEDNWVNARTNTEILIHMLWNWKVVHSQITSIPHLHGWLGKYFNKYQLGDQKRLEKICQRIHLSFGPAGRPKTKKK